ncbi:MAG: YggS family pyridoxal phosphate-dependent enzyme [Oscillospiraceae bacterium]|nr:YggS family pyridoxal phosphate-dependent enzyme [Oscillospiraceae bacterium]
MIYNEITENYKIITENVEETRRNFGINDEVRVMAVTKGVPHEKVNHAISLGIELIGENRAQELLQKEPFYAKTTKNAKKLEIHFIGGLQNNKVRYIIDKVGLIQSVDSEKLLTEIDKRAAAHGLVMDTLIEVNIGCEYSKGGVKPDELFEFMAVVEIFRNVRLRGLMAIPPINAPEKIYADMQTLFHDAKGKVNPAKSANFDTLSIGMSGDYITAIKHGANLIRIGSALFGSR